MSDSKQNQCDGCQAGMPQKDGIHYHSNLNLSSATVMYCTKDRYTSLTQQSDKCDCHKREDCKNESTCYYHRPPEEVPEKCHVCKLPLSGKGEMYCSVGHNRSPQLETKEGWESIKMPKLCLVHKKPIPQNCDNCSYEKEIKSFISNLVEEEHMKGYRSGKEDCADNFHAVERAVGFEECLDSVIGIIESELKKEPRVLEYEWEAGHKEALTSLLLTLRGK